MVIGLGYQITRKLLDFGRLTAAFCAAAVARLLLESVAELRAAKPFPDTRHECNDGVRQSFAISLFIAKLIDEFFEVRASVPLPKRNTAVKKPAKRSRSLVVTREYQKR